MRHKQISCFHTIIPFVMAFRNFTNGFLSTYFNRRMMHQCSHLISFRSITSSSYNVELNIDTPETMEEVGGVISSVTKPGDIVFLDGDLGAGKTCFSRGFIRTRSGVSDLRVTSPTYLLCNTYPSYDDVPIHHMDLYRLSSEKEDFSPLNLDYVFQNCISLIEWPSRLKPSQIPESRLEITFRIDMGNDTTIDGDDCKSRRLVIQPYGLSWINRLRDLQQEGYIDDLIITNGLAK